MMEDTANVKQKNYKITKELQKIWSLTSVMAQNQ